MTTLLDTGPLVALLDLRDQHHRWATTQLTHLSGPFLTCEAVIAETNACMVRLSELHPRAKLATVDSDFSFYRRHGRERIPLLAPFAS